MSQAGLAAFLAAVRRDPALQARLHHCDPVQAAALAQELGHALRRSYPLRVARLCLAGERYGIRTGGAPADAPLALVAVLLAAAAGQPDRGLG